MASVAATGQNKRVVLFAYREVLKAIKDTFKGKSKHRDEVNATKGAPGDVSMMNKARVEARKQFNANRNATDDSVASEQGVEHALAVAQILRENVVQGEGAGSMPHHYSRSTILFWTFKMSLTTIELNIRDSTERGDNDTVKAPKAEPPTPEQKRFRNSAKKFEK